MAERRFRSEQSSDMESSGEVSVEGGFRIGEIPGPGTYKCISCDENLIVTLPGDERLPPCGICGVGQDVRYIKVSDATSRPK